MSGVAAFGAMTDCSIQAPHPRQRRGEEPLEKIAGFCTPVRPLRGDRGRIAPITPSPQTDHRRHISLESPRHHPWPRNGADSITPGQGGYANPNNTFDAFTSAVLRRSPRQHPDPGHGDQFRRLQPRQTEDQPGQCVCSGASPTSIGGIYITLQAPGTTTASCRVARGSGSQVGCCRWLCARTQRRLFAG